MVNSKCIVGNNFDEDEQNEKVRKYLMQKEIIIMIIIIDGHTRMFESNEKAIRENMNYFMLFVIIKLEILVENEDVGGIGGVRSGFKAL